MEVRRTDTPDVAAAQHLTLLIEGHEGDTLCFLAGGSAMNIYKHLHLAENMKGRTIFCMGDERWSREPKDNNYLQLCALAPDFVRDHQVIDTAVLEDENLHSYAKRINDQIEKIISEKNNVNIICPRGIGPDEHTASIFPLDEKHFHEAYDIDSTYVPVSVAGLTIDSRASLTPQFIANAHHLIGYVSGDAKATKLDELINTNQELNEMPAQILKRHKDAVVFTDITDWTS